MSGKIYRFKPELVSFFQNVNMDLLMSIDGEKVHQMSETRVFFEERICGFTDIISFFNIWKGVKYHKPSTDAGSYNSVSEIELNEYEKEALKDAINFTIEQKKTKMISLSSSIQSIDIEQYKKDIELLERGILQNKDFMNITSFMKEEEIQPESLTDSQKDSLQKLDQFLKDSLLALRSGLL